jgi:TonB family protein
VNGTGFSAHSQTLANQVEVVRFVGPVYPAAARSARIIGKTLVRISVAKDGTVTAASFVSGHPLLAKAALDAVKQWKFRPEAKEYTLDVACSFELCDDCRSETQVIADLPASVTVRTGPICIETNVD